jgi:hypothetical protein
VVKKEKVTAQRSAAPPQDEAKKVQSLQEKLQKMEIKLADAEKNRDREQLEIREQLAREMRDQLARNSLCVCYFKGYTEQLWVV